MMLEIWNEQEGSSKLLPPQESGLILVLFVSDREAQREYIERYAESSKALELRSVVVEVDADSHALDSLSSWFRLNSYPTLVTLYNGMLLALESNCDQGSCVAVMEEAIAQYRVLLDVHI